MYQASCPVGRFLTKIDIIGNHWRWLGRINPGGYGIFYNGHNLAYVHVWSYKHFVGPIPPGYLVHHDLCQYEDCSNPKCLKAVPRDNHSGAAPDLNRSKTCCPQGHLYDRTNTEYCPDGSRRCRICHRQQSSDYYYSKLGQERILKRCTDADILYTKYLLSQGFSYREVRRLVGVSVSFKTLGEWKKGL